MTNILTPSDQGIHGIHSQSLKVSCVVLIVPPTVLRISLSLYCSVKTLKETQQAQLKNFFSSAFSPEFNESSLF